MQDEEVTFNVFNAINHPMGSESCFKIDIVEAIVSSQKDHIDPYLGGVWWIIICCFVMQTIGNQ